MSYRLLVLTLLILLVLFIQAHLSASPQHKDNQYFDIQISPPQLVIDLNSTRTYSFNITISLNSTWFEAMKLANVTTKINISFPPYLVPSQEKRYQYFQCHQQLCNSTLIFTQENYTQKFTIQIENINLNDTLFKGQEKNLTISIKIDAFNESGNVLNNSPTELIYFPLNVVYLHLQFSSMFNKTHVCINITNAGAGKTEGPIRGNISLISPFLANITYHENINITPIKGKNKSWNFSLDLDQGDKARVCFTNFKIDLTDLTFDEKNNNLTRIKLTLFLNNIKQQDFTLNVKTWVNLSKPEIMSKNLARLLRLNLTVYSNFTFTYNASLNIVLYHEKLQLVINNTSSQFKQQLSGKHTNQTVSLLYNITVRPPDGEYTTETACFNLTIENNNKVSLKNSSTIFLNIFSKLNYTPIPMTFLGDTGKIADGNYTFNICGETRTLTSSNQFLITGASWLFWPVDFQCTLKPKTIIGIYTNKQGASYYVYTNSQIWIFKGILLVIFVIIFGIIVLWIVLREQGEKRMEIPTATPDEDVIDID
jgi:hypothetical protein